MDAAYLTDLANELLVLGGMMMEDESPSLLHRRASLSELEEVVGKLRKVSEDLTLLGACAELLLRLAGSAGAALNG
jgi:hypothetical protein